MHYNFFQAGSKEERVGKQLAGKIQDALKRTYDNDFIIDDRVDQTVGKRLLDAKRLGIPFIAVFGKSVSSLPQPLIEVHDVNAGTVQMILEKDIFNFFYDIKSSLAICQ